MKKAVLEFNANLKDLNGKELEGNTIGQTLAGVLAVQTKGDALKMMSWALKLQANEPLDLDMSDRDLLKNFIKENEQMTNLLKYQLLVNF